MDAACPQAADASWKGKVEAVVEELQKEKAAGKDAARRAGEAADAAAARIRELEAALAANTQALKAKEAECSK